MSTTSVKKGLTSIVIPICNTDYPVCHYLANCLGSIRYHTDKKKDPYEIIVVDNGSTVELGGWKWDKAVDKYIKNEKNEGVPKAWNQGIEAAQGEFICIMNSDIQVFDHWLEDLKEGLNHVAVATAYPMYDMPWGRAAEARDRREEWLYKTPHQYMKDFQDFSCILTTRKIFDEVGLFDEEYCAGDKVGYGEDVDWKFALEEKGYKCKANHRCNIHHVGMATAHTLRMQNAIKLDESMNKNKKYTEKKWKLDKYNQPKFRRDRAKKLN